MRIQQLIIGCFKQAFHKMFAKRCRILHTSRIRKRRHKDPSCVRSPSVSERALIVVSITSLFAYVTIQILLANSTKLCYDDNADNDCI